MWLRAEGATEGGTTVTASSGGNQQAFLRRKRRTAPLKITHIITEADLLGGAQLNTLFSLQFQQRSHGVECIVGNDGPLREQCERSGIACAVISMKNSLATPVTDVRSLVKLVRFLRRSRPDIVHTHSSKAGVIGRIAARLAWVPVVLHTMHAMPFNDRQPVYVQRAIIALERAMTMITDEQIVVADTLGIDLVKHRVCTPDQVVTVVSGIDFARFPKDYVDCRRSLRDELGLPPHAYVISSVGHLSRRKAHDVLLRVASALIPDHPQLWFLIVGGGSLESALRAEIAFLGLTDRVLLLGVRDDVPRILAASDIFVQTSWQEGLSRSLVEAMYCGLPVVATDVNATKEVVRDGETGFLVRAGDHAAMAARIKELLADSRLREQLGRGGRAAVSETRTVDAMGEALSQIYERHIARYRRSSSQSRRFPLGLRGKY